MDAKALRRWFRRARRSLGSPTPRARTRKGVGRRRAPGRRPSRARLRRRLGRAGTGSCVLLLGLLGLTWACVTPPPTQPEDACAIFYENLDWYRAARSSEERWGVAAAVQLAVIHQESSFRAQARPPRGRLLWVLPGPRPSSAYGYGQVIDGTWAHYRSSAGRPGADRDDFADVADFIGWYGQQIRARTGLPAEDTRSFYLAYHEGPTGFVRGSHRDKRWLVRVSERVARRADRYGRQLDRCRADLDERVRGPWWWPF